MGNQSPTSQRGRPNRPRGKQPNAPPVGGVGHAVEPSIRRRDRQGALAGLTAEEVTTDTCPKRTVSYTRDMRPNRELKTRSTMGPNPADVVAAGRYLTCARHEPRAHETSGSSVDLAVRPRALAALRAGDLNLPQARRPSMPTVVKSHCWHFHAAAARLAAPRTFHTRRYDVALGTFDSRHGGASWRAAKRGSWGRISA
jgi:hypothetical protein